MLVWFHSQPIYSCRLDLVLCSMVTPIQSILVGWILFFAFFVPQRSSSPTPLPVGCWVASPIRSWVASLVRSWVTSPIRSWVASPVRSWVASPLRSWVASPVSSWVASPLRSWVASPVSSWVASPTCHWVALEYNLWVLCVHLGLQVLCGGLCHLLFQWVEDY